MSKQTSFAHQKQVLEQFSSLLYAFESELKELVNKYEEGISSLYDEQGLMEEVYEEYKNTYLEPLKAASSEVLSRIQEEDIPFIEKEIDFISSR
jgi:hypothetical protein